MSAGPTGRSLDDLGPVLNALRDAGISTSRQARALGVSENTVVRWRGLLGIASPARTAPTALPGERWVDRSDLGVRVSDQNRVASLKTGLLLRQTRGKGSPYVSVRVGTPGQTTVQVHLLVAETFGLERPATPYHNPWREEELDTLRRCKTFDEAAASLPGRTREAIRFRARMIGAKLKRRLSKPRPERPARADEFAPIRGSVPHLDPFWREADAAVPRGIPAHIREDLISTVVLLRLEGFEGPTALALKEARREYARSSASFKERSIFAPIPGTDGLRLVDTLEAGTSL